jgi:succinate dehydrogenase/fumarate reductase flavoprotein subunit
MPIRTCPNIVGAAIQTGRRVLLQCTFPSECGNRSVANYLADPKMPVQTDPIEVDIVVIGSGVGGLTAAITAGLAGARVLVLEKAGCLGGTTAWSGGAAWVPCNPHMPELGIEDSREAAKAYLKNVMGAVFDQRMVDTFLDHGRTMISELEAKTSVKFTPLQVPDYDPNFPGAVSGGRTLLPVPFDGRKLGATLQRMRAAKREFTTLRGMQIDPVEAAHLQNSWRRWNSFRISLGLIFPYIIARLRFGRDTRLIRGQALIGRLLRSASDLKVEIRTGVAVENLVVREGRVTGVSVRGGDSEVITARCAVMVATGGFAANKEMCEKYYPLAQQHIQMLPDTNQGEGLTMALAIGAVLGSGNADAGIWMPASSHVYRDGTVGRFPDFSFHRVKPGSIMVDATGKRFVNEAASYHSVVRVMHAQRVSPAWLIADRSFLRKYGLGLVRPFPFPFRHYVRQGYLIEAASVAALAQAIAVDAAALQQTIARFNRFADVGVDADFGKGGDIYSRALGDREHRPNPCLGPVQQPPFYAIALYPSSCGTALGLRTNEHAQVLNTSGHAIEGLYACGLDMNSVFRGHYPGGGANIGPAMTFGFIAARHATRDITGGAGCRDAPQRRASAGLL